MNASNPSFGLSIYRISTKSFDWPDYPIMRHDRGSIYSFQTRCMTLSSATSNRSPVFHLQARVCAVFQHLIGLLLSVCMKALLPLPATTTPNHRRFARDRTWLTSRPSGNLTRSRDERAQSTLEYIHTLMAGAGSDRLPCVARGRLWSLTATCCYLETLAGASKSIKSLNCG